MRIRIDAAMSGDRTVAAALRIFDSTREFAATLDAATARQIARALAQVADEIDRDSAQPSASEPAPATAEAARN